VDFLARLDHATTLSRAGASVATVEHLLSALAGVGVDDVLVDLDGPEVPIMDGSSAPFVDLLIEAGIRGQGSPRRYIKILEPIEVQSRDKWLRLAPADERSIEYTIAFDHPQLRHQSKAYRLSPESFVVEIAPARTFGFLRDVDLLRENGLAKGGTLDNAIVFGPQGPLQPLRFSDECVRHKILDAIGDLAMAGMPVLGALTAYRAGHALHAALVQRLLASPRSYAVITPGRGTHASLQAQPAAS